MYNMLPESIDVTEYIESGEFRPDSCEGRLDRLIKVNPLKLNSTHELQLQGKLRQWKTENNSRLITNDSDTIKLEDIGLLSKTTYQYSYFITTKPVDVYRTDWIINTIENKQFCLFIQFDENGNINSNYEDHGWVINSCDSIN